MNKKRFIHKSIYAVSAAIVLSGIASFASVSGLCTEQLSLSAHAEAIYSPLIQRTGGPGDASGSTISTGTDGPGTGPAGAAAEPEAPQYTFDISSFVPYGLTDVSTVDVPDPIVADENIYSYQILQEDLQALYGRYGSDMSYHSLGQTPDGREVYEVILGNQSASKHVLFNAALHAREYITSNVLMKQIEYLLYYMDRGAFDGRSVRSWLQDTCIHFVPMDNPDGVSISQFGLSGLQNEALRLLVQAAYVTDVANDKTHLDFDKYLVRWKANGLGVDLNENFSFAWANAESKLTIPSAAWFKGLTPNSEPETQMLVNLLNSRHFDAVINYHAMGNVIYWDFDENSVREKCQDLMTNISALTGYAPHTDIAGGGMKEYICTKADPSPSLTIEVGSTSSPVDPGELPVIWAKNKMVPLFVAKWCKEKT